MKSIKNAFVTYNNIKKRSISLAIIIIGLTTWPLYSIDLQSYLSQEESPNDTNIRNNYFDRIDELRQAYTSYSDTNQQATKILNLHDNVSVEFGLDNNSTGHFYVRDVLVNNTSIGNLNEGQESYAQMGTQPRNLSVVEALLRNTISTSQNPAPPLSLNEKQYVYGFFALTFSEAARFNNLYRGEVQKQFINNPAVINFWDFMVDVYETGSSEPKCKAWLSLIQNWATLSQPNNKEYLNQNKTKNVVDTPKRLS